MDAKKKKILIIAMIVCFVIAAAALTGAIFAKRGNNPKPTGTTAAGKAATTAAVTKGDAAGEEYVEEEQYKADYEQIASSNIKGDPDAKIKAYFFNKVKQATPDAEIASFDLIKTYDAFRIFDTTGTTKAEGKQNFLLVVYTEGNLAKLVFYETYQTSDERADLLTKFIQDLDNDYERYVVETKKLEGDYILYE